MFTKILRLSVARPNFSRVASNLFGNFYSTCGTQNAGRIVCGVTRSNQNNYSTTDNFRKPNNYWTVPDFSRAANATPIPIGSLEHSLPLVGTDCKKRKRTDVPDDTTVLNFLDDRNSLSHSSEWNFSDFDLNNGNLSDDNSNHVLSKELNKFLESAASLGSISDELYRTPRDDRSTSSETNIETTSSEELDNTMDIFSTPPDVASMPQNARNSSNLEPIEQKINPRHPFSLETILELSNENMVNDTNINAKPIGEDDKKVKSLAELGIRENSFNLDVLVEEFRRLFPAQRQNTDESPSSANANATKSGSNGAPGTSSHNNPSGSPNVIDSTDDTASTSSTSLSSDPDFEKEVQEIINEYNRRIQRMN